MADTKVPSPPAPKPTAVPMCAVTVVHIGKNGVHKPGEKFFAPSLTEAEWLVENGAATRAEPLAGEA